MSYSDLDLAVKLVNQHRGHLRYCPQMGRSGAWLTWNGKIWTTDKSAAFELLRNLVDDKMREALEVEGEKQQAAAIKAAERLRSNRKLTDVLKCCERLRELQTGPNELNADPWTLNVQNGLLDLKSGVLRAHDPKALCTQIAAVNYDENAQCPKWEKFLEWAQPDKSVRTVLQTVLGYTLTGLTTEQIIVIFHGPKGNNGKNLVCDMVYRLLGDYALQVPPQILMTRQYGGIPNDVAQLNGKRYVVASESKDSHKLNEPLVKSLTGDSAITARYLYSEFFTFKPQFTFFLITNKQPIITDTDNAIWRRIKLLPWLASVSEDEVDTTLAEKFWAEREGILRWLVDGCLMWNNGGGRIRWPAVIEEAIDAYRIEQDVVGMFVEDNMATTLDDQGISKAELYKLYRHWCEAEGRKPMSNMRLTRDLQERGFKEKRTKSARYWKYLTLSFRGDLLKTQAEANRKLVSTEI